MRHRLPWNRLLAPLCFLCHPERLPPDAIGLAWSPKVWHQQALVPPFCVLWSKSPRRESPACRSVPVGGRCVPGMRGSWESRPCARSAVWVGGGGQDRSMQGPRWPGHRWALQGQHEPRECGAAPTGLPSAAWVRLQSTHPLPCEGGSVLPRPFLGMPTAGGREEARLSSGCQRLGRALGKLRGPVLGRKEAPKVGPTQSLRL